MRMPQGCIASGAAVKRPRPASTGDHWASPWHPGRRMARGLDPHQPSQDRQQVLPKLVRTREKGRHARTAGHAHQMEPFMEPFMEPLTTQTSSCKAFHECINDENRANKHQCACGHAPGPPTTPLPAPTPAPPPNTEEWEVGWMEIFLPPRPPTAAAAAAATAADRLRMEACTSRHSWGSMM